MGWKVGEIHLIWLLFTLWDTVNITWPSFNSGFSIKLFDWLLMCRLWQSNKRLGKRGIKFALTLKLVTNWCLKSTTSVWNLGLLNLHAILQQAPVVPHSSIISMEHGPFAGFLHVCSPSQQFLDEGLELYVYTFIHVWLSCKCITGCTDCKDLYTMAHSNYT